MNHIEQVIKEAVEKGGYEPRIVCIKETGQKIVVTDENKSLLDPLFWQALGKARGIIPGQSAKHQWMIDWHRFIDHLIEGKDADSFFASL